MYINEMSHQSYFSKFEEEMRFIHKSSIYQHTDILYNSEKWFKYTEHTSLPYCFYS